MADVENSTFKAPPGVKVVTSKAQLASEDRPLPEMAAWCLQRKNIIVLKSGTILTADPGSRDVQNCRIAMVNKSIRPGEVLVAAPSLINSMLENLGSIKDYQQIQEEMTEEISGQQKRLRTLVQEAVDADVSDIHMEIRADVCKIRFRKYGELYLHAEWFPRLGREVAAVAFNKETDHATAHFNPLVPQDAAMPLKVKSGDIRLRLASMPAHGGFDMVMRILGTEKESKAVSLEELGYTIDQIYIIKRAIQMPHGAVLLSGPTGSGKTTTLAACLHLIKTTRKVYTIEDPVEKVVHTATQVPVNVKTDDRSFASFGRAALRMDPDYIVLGEMRDEDTANVMLRATITGHLVCSTIHTNSAPGIILRLADMGISPVMLSDSNVLVCLIFQRLVAVLCPHCKIPVKTAKAHVDHMHRWDIIFGEMVEQLYARKPGGCDKCHNSALAGRKVVAEVVWVDEKGREFIQKLDILSWERYLRSMGWRTYRDRTVEMVREGLVDPFDAEALIGEMSLTDESKGFDYNLAREQMEKEEARKKGS
jgi:type II secretory ATPase GspE/PulE/Tfp pilus assembly ATPase PilB-like protein